MTDKQHNSQSSLRAQIRIWAPVLLTCGLLAAYSFKSGDPAPPISFSLRDKVDHFCVYGLIAIFVLKALPATLQGTLRWLAAFALVSSFGLCDEIIQHNNPARTGDPLDWFADSLGALAAVVLYTSVAPIRRLADFRLPTRRSEAS